VRPEVLAYYRQRGATVVDGSADQARRGAAAPPSLTLCHQDTTDLHKCLSLVAAHPLAAPPAALRVAVLGALGGGRMDHQLAALSTLHAFPALHVTLLSERSSARLLQAGSHRLAPLCAGGGCSLVPLGARASRRRADAGAHARRSRPRHRHHDRPAVGHARHAAGDGRAGA